MEAQRRKGMISIVIPVKTTVVPQSFITHISGHLGDWGGSEIYHAFKLFNDKAPLVGFLGCIMS